MCSIAAVETLETNGNESVIRRSASCRRGADGTTQQAKPPPCHRVTGRRREDTTETQADMLGTLRRLTFQRRSPADRRSARECLRTVVCGRGRRPQFAEGPDGVPDLRANCREPKLLHTGRKMRLVRRNPRQNSTSETCGYG